MCVLKVVAIYQTATVIVRLTLPSVQGHNLPCALAQEFGFARVAILVGTIHKIQNMDTIFSRGDFFGGEEANGLDRTDELLISVISYY